MTEQATDLTVRRTITVAAPQERAFRVFTEEYGEWNPPGHHLGDVEPDEVVLEPRAGGRWFERAPDGAECEWGRVLAFEPPERLLLAWHLDHEFRYQADPALSTEVEIRFIADGEDRTRVELEHRGLEVHGDGAAAMGAAIDSPDGWPLALKCFAAAAVS